METKKKKLVPEDIWHEYIKGTEYLHRHDIYNIVKINENFYDGDQWGGLETKTMPTPVFNVLQRAGKYMVATLGSNDVAISLNPFSSLPADTELMNIVSKEIEKIVETTKTKELYKVAIRNSFVDGSSFSLQMFEPDYETNQPMKGRIKNQLVDNTNVIFGNPYSNDIQKQPFIIIALRQHIQNVLMEAKDMGASEDELGKIQPDNDYTQTNDESTNLVTVLLKFYKKRKTEVVEEPYFDEVENIEKVKYTEKKVDSVWFTKTTEHAVIIGETELGYKRYPIACFGWDLIKNSYLYNSPMTSVIDNQIFINKCFAIAQMYGLQSAFPKVVYDKNKVDIEDFMNSSATAVAGIDLMGKFLDFIKIPDFSNNIIELAQETIAQTKDALGVTDASLGNVRPDNTSAIIALQEASNVPLEIQKQQFYEFWEDTVRNIIDIATCTYGKRQINENGAILEIDFEKLKDMNYNLNVEIGNSAQFSEIAQINTLDKLVQAGYIAPDDYIEAVPNKYIPQKEKLLKSYREKVVPMSQMGIAPTTRGSNQTDETVPL